MLLLLFLPGSRFVLQQVTDAIILWIDAFTSPSLEGTKQTDVRFGFLSLISRLLDPLRKMSTVLGKLLGKFRILGEVIDLMRILGNRSRPPLDCLGCGHLTTWPAPATPPCDDHGRRFRQT